MEKPVMAYDPFNTIIMRVKLGKELGLVSKVTQVIAEHQGDVGAIDIIKPLKKGGSIRDFTIGTHGTEHANQILQALQGMSDIKILQFSDRVMLAHLGGKIEIRSRIPLKTRDDLSIAYTPGVAKVCMSIYQEPRNAYKLTIKKNTVAVITDGSAVLGLGNLGSIAGMPVMEGKAMLFKEFANVDAFPICLAEQDTEAIIQAVKMIAPGFGGINLEDIAAPRCFEVEARLRQELDIPVFHDDQHGTAVVTTAALINALKVVKKTAESLKVVVNGAGAAGTACTKMMMSLGIKHIIVCDRLGAIYAGRDGLNDAKQWFVENTNLEKRRGSLKEVIAGADLFMGLSSPNVLNAEDIKRMNPDPIVFAMANPTPEIMPEEAGPHVAIMATGRSDYPNQINNVLCFPGIFRGALDCMATTINEEMKMAAAKAIASCIEEEYLQRDYIIPSVFDPKVASSVAKAVAEAAVRTGVARKESL